MEIRTVAFESDLIITLEGNQKIVLPLLKLMSLDILNWELMRLNR